MASKKQGDELFGMLRERGVRKKVAKSVARLDGNARRAGAKGEAIAQKVVEDLDAAADDIRKRVLRTDRRRSRGARKAAQTRARKASKRSSAARKGAQTRAKVSRARSSARKRTRSTRR
jgi:hypothetical protein